MKIVFRKIAPSNEGEKTTVNVFLKKNGIEKEFAYVNMIKDLIDSKSMGEPVIEGDFLEAEKYCIFNMVQEINEVVGGSESSSLSEPIIAETNFDVFKS